MCNLSKNFNCEDLSDPDKLNNLSDLEYFASVALKGILSNNELYNSIVSKYFKRNNESECDDREIMTEICKVSVQYALLLKSELKIYK